MSQKPAPKTLLASGRYEILSLLGEGGMGKVFLATDHNLETKVVIKIPHAAMLADAEFVARFQREIRSLVKLRHRSIVSILDVGEQDGVPFAVMQYLEGGSLEDRLANGPQAEDALKDWLPDVAVALDFIHRTNDADREGYVHRDIKPGNILFDREGNAYVGDFGVVKVVGEHEAQQTSRKSLTGAGMVMGTPEYMAPELVMGEPFDHRVDQYALAVTVFECLCGRRPFEGEVGAVMVKHSTEPAPGVQKFCPSASAAVVSAVARGLSKKPAARFESCSQLAAALLGQGNANTPSGGSAATAPQPVQDQAHKLNCPGCGGKLRLGSRYAGKTIKCPGCKASMKVAEDFSSLMPLLADSDALAVGIGDTSKISANATASRSKQNAPKSSVAARNPVLIVSAGFAALLVMILAGVLLFRKSVTELSATPVPPVAVTTPPETRIVETTNPSKPGGHVKPTVSMGIVDVPDATIDEETELRLTVDTTLPRSGKSRLQLKRGSPPGLNLNAASGILSWTPTEAQGPGTYPITIELTDTIGKLIEDKCEFTVTVNEVNQPPVLAAITPQVAKANMPFLFRVDGRDPDIPANGIQFSLKGEIPEGLTINEQSGDVSWDVSYRQKESAFTMTVTVADAAGLAVSRDLELSIVPLLPLAIPFDSNTGALGQKLVAEQSAQPEEFVNSLGGRFRLIPPGEFPAGSPAVKVTEAFYIGTTEVTQGQWCSLMGGEVSLGRSVAQDQISPADADEFCRKLSMLDGIEYRLPTESEWEFACRAGTESAYSVAVLTGDDSEKYKRFANVKVFNREGTVQPGGVTLLRPKAPGLPETVMRTSNRFGLFDTHGNVAEFCRASGGTTPVVRGGSYQSSPDDCVSAARNSVVGTSAGLRLVAIPGAKTKKMDDVGSSSGPVALSEVTNSIGMEFVLIPAGQFKMGAIDNERSAGREEKPQHAVEITRPFYMGRFEVSQAMYERVMDGKKVQREGSWRLAKKIPAAFSRKGPTSDLVKSLSESDLEYLPVESITWLEANEFCEELTKLIPEKNQNRRYRLPTEAEWEYACRAGSETAFSFGRHLNGTEANIDGNTPYEIAQKGPFQQRTEVIGRSGPANAVGLFDMHGNIAEWCLDFYDANYYQQSPKLDPKGPPAGNGHVYKGGSWKRPAEEARSAARRNGNPDFAGPEVGFRVVLEVNP